MRNPVEIRQVDVGRGKARKIGRRRGGDGGRFSVLEPNPNDVLNGARCLRLRLWLNIFINIGCLSVQASDRDQDHHAKYEHFDNLVIRFSVAKTKLKLWVIQIAKCQNGKRLSGAFPS